MAGPDSVDSLFAGTSSMSRSLQLSVRGPRRRTLRGGCHGQTRPGCTNAESGNRGSEKETLRNAIKKGQLSSDPARLELIFKSEQQD